MLKIALAITNKKLDEFRHCQNYYFYTLEKDSKAIPKPEIIKAEGCKSIIGKTFQLIDAKINLLIVSEINPDDEMVLNNSEIEVRKIPGKDVGEIPYQKDNLKRYVERIIEQGS